MSQAVALRGKEASPLARCAAAAPAPESPAAAVAAVLDRPDRELDYLEAKLAFESLVDPAIDREWVRQEVERLAATARTMARPWAGSAARLAALRALIYEPGPWNGQRPFAYDQDDPFSPGNRNSLLAHYLSTRRGNCISMPVLFLALAERLGVELKLVRAPSHILLGQAGADGRLVYMEATSGAHPARPEWIRQNISISDRGIETGLYLKPLSRREGVVLLAGCLAEHFIIVKRYQQAIDVCQAALVHDPAAATLLAAQGCAYGWLLGTEFQERYKVPFLVPEHLRFRRLLLTERNRTLFDAAEALGWRQDG